MAGQEGSVAPKERVNIVYKPATGDAQEEKELPLKLLMMGDYTLRQDDTPVEDRKPINVNKDNFNDVMKAQNLSLTFNVTNTLADVEGEDLAVNLDFDSLADFSPENVANKVPELQQLLQLREALAALKGPLGNFPQFRKKIQSLISDEASAEKLLAELGGVSGDDGGAG